MMIKLEVRDVNSALMQTSFACLLAARAETLKIACLTLGKAYTFGDISLFIESVFEK